MQWEEQSVRGPVKNANSEPKNGLTVTERKETGQELWEGRDKGREIERGPYN